MIDNNLLILNFHSIFRPDSKNKFHFDPVFSISEEKLIKCFEFIKNNYTNCCYWSDILIDKSKNKNQVALSFDDGHVSDYEIVVPLLKQYDFDACFFVVAENILNDKDAWNRTKKISDLGFTIGSHGFSHQKMTLLSINEQKNEMQESKRIIENCIGKEISLFAFPEGRYDKKLIKLGQNIGYKKMLTTQSKWNNNSTFNICLGRWSIKQKTNNHFIEKVLLRKKQSISKLSLSSILKFYLLKINDKLSS